MLINLIRAYFVTVMAGRPPASRFHTLEINEVIELKGKPKKHVYQYVHQFNHSTSRRADGKKLMHFKEGDIQYVKRIK